MSLVSTGNVKMGCSMINAFSRIGASYNMKPNRRQTLTVIFPIAIVNTFSKKNMGLYERGLEYKEMHWPYCLRVFVERGRLRASERDVDFDRLELHYFKIHAIAIID